MNEYMTIREAAATIQRPQGYIRALIRAGRITAVKPARDIFLEKDNILAIKNNQPRLCRADYGVQ